jgi:hypothetical protein
MHKVVGGGLPARIWREVMLAAHDRLPPGDLPGYAAIAGAGVDQRGDRTTAVRAAQR